MREIRSAKAALSNGCPKMWPVPVLDTPSIANSSRKTHGTGLAIRRHSRFRLAVEGEMWSVLERSILIDEWVC